MFDLFRIELSVTRIDIDQNWPSPDGMDVQKIGFILIRGEDDLIARLYTDRAESGLTRQRSTGTGEHMGHYMKAC